MKKLEPIPKVLIVMTAIFAIVVFLYFLGYWVISNEWRREFSKEKVSEWADSIKISPEVPRNFDTVFNTIYPFARKNNLTNSFHDLVWKNLTGFWPKRRYGRDFYSQKVAELIKEKDYKIWRNMFDKSLIMAYGLENFVTPSKCVDYYLNNFTINININKSDTILKINGIRAISNYEFKKEIYELTEDEIISIIAYIDLGEYHKDKYKFPKQFESRKRILKDVLKRNRKKLTLANTGYTQ